MGQLYASCSWDIWTPTRPTESEPPSLKLIRVFKIKAPRVVPIGSSDDPDRATVEGGHGDGLAEGGQVKRVVV
jgi:hypothetical protein